MEQPLSTVPSTLDSVRTREGSVKPGKDPAPFLDGIEKPDVESPTDRRYRSAPVRTVTLPDSFAEESGGTLTRKGTPRLDLLAAARAAYVQRKADENESDALGFDSGAHSVRRDGTHVKSIQGHAEDVWRRIYKRPVPRGDPLENEEFHRLYRRMQASLRRSGLLEDWGPAVDDPDKTFRDQHGKRWGLSGGLEDAQSGRESAEPPPFVRCAGQAPEVGTGDVWADVERHVAREEKLHREFTHVITASSLQGPRWTAEGRRFERRYAREGSDRPRYHTVGRWRGEALGRPGRRRRAVRVPWIIAEIDGRKPGGSKDRGRSDRLARRLLRRLKDFGVDLSGVVVSYSGNASIHVRIPDGAIGCPIYQNAQAAEESIARLFDRLCGEDEKLRQAIDDACFRPGQLIRAVGSVHEATGRRVVATDGQSFLDRPSSFLWALSEPQFQYSAPETLPLPRRSRFVPGVSSLLSPSKRSPSRGHQRANVSQNSSRGSGGGVDGSGSLMERVSGGVREGEPWGMDLGERYEGRNWAALFAAHGAFRRVEDVSSAWEAVKQWNRRNDPPLPVGELRKTFRSVCRYRRGFVP